MRAYWFKCPECKLLVIVDGDQANGLVSIDCPTINCSFHKTGIVVPKVELTVPTNRNTFTTELV